MAVVALGPVLLNVVLLLHIALVWDLPIPESAARPTCVPYAQQRTEC